MAPATFQQRLLRPFSKAPATDSAADQKRKADAERMIAKNPQLFPVMVDKAANSGLPDIDKKRFMVPVYMLCGELKYIIHKSLSKIADEAIKSDQTIYLFAGGTSPKTGEKVSDIYAIHKADHNFLHITYSAEATLGNNMC